MFAGAGMNEQTAEERDPPWYHALPSWWPVAAFVIAAMVSGVEAYGQIADHGKRIDKLEQLAPELDRRMSQVVTRTEDETARLDRIETKLDRALSQQNIPH